MSAPNTNVETQEKRHRPSLGGMSIAVGVAALLLLGWLAWIFAAAEGPEGAETQIDGRTGTQVQSE